MLISTLHFFSRDFMLLSSYTCERYCSKLLILKENWHAQFVKVKRSER